ncbi:hypothetical protein ACT4WE_11805 [Acinetobacter baumannii]
MAVPEQTPFIEYTANGTTTVYPLTFDCDKSEYLIVSLDGEEAPVGSWSLTGGSITFNTAPANGVLITIERNTPFRRTTNYQSYDNSFRPAPVNKDFDLIWWKLQELGVADWILHNRIDALKAYVDDRDDELRAYLMEEIRKQGVALDQLDEYYNYLMQRLAQIAVDKGWEASFVVSAGGDNQQEINDRGGSYWREKPLGYDINSRVMLENGDIVKSTVAGNTVDPNVDMTGWVNFESDTSNQISELDQKSTALNSKLAGDVVSQQAGAMFTENLLEYIPDYKTIVLERLIDSYQIYRKCGEGVWERIQMKTNTVGNPLRVGEIWLTKPSAYAVPYVDTSVTLTGAWAEQRSGGADMFVGGVEAYSNTMGDKASKSITLNATGSIGIVVRTSTNTGKLKVKINGGTSLISLQSKDINGDVVIDTYSATQTYKVHIPLASALPPGTYNIEVEVLGEKNPLSIAHRINLNGFYFQADGISDPLSDLTHAPLWVPSTTVVANEHRYWLGNEYSAVAGGTTGTTPPTHTTGTVSDGSVSWLWIRSSYGSDSQMIRQDTSESEFAGVQQNIVTGVTGEWGGDIHGGERLDNLEIVVDGSIVNPAAGDVIRCSMVSFKQNTTGLDTTASNEPMLSIVQRHDFTSDGVNYEYTQTALKQLKITSFYQWMHTIYHYDQLSRRFLFDYVHTPRRGRYKIADSYGNSAVRFGLESSKEIMATGTAFKPVGTAGSPSTTGGTHRVIFKLSTSDEYMGFYKKTTAGAYVQVNPSGKNQPDGGVLEPNSGFFTKLYYASVRNNTLDMAVGDELRGGGSWRTSAIQN